MHFRAPPDVRGSGKERGHGTELKFCPKCGKELKPGKHHVGCAAGKSAPRQAAKRRRNVSSSEDDPESGNQSSHSSSWQRLVESAVQRRRTRTRRPRGVDDGKAAEAAESEEVLVSNPGAGSRQRECKVEAMEASDLLGHGPLDSDLLPNPMDTAEGLPDGEHGQGLAWHLMEDNQEIERLPSPPPLPLDWELGGNDVASSHGFLFDFGQFDSNKAAMRRQSSNPVAVKVDGPAMDPNLEIGPHTTAVSSMTPQNMSNPSDDYIWQILFSNPTDDVPKRVTAHMHNPMSHNAELATLEDLGAFDPMLPDVLPAPRPAGVEGNARTRGVDGKDGDVNAKHVEDEGRPGATDA